MSAIGAVEQATEHAARTLELFAAAEGRRAGAKDPGGTTLAQRSHEDTESADQFRELAESCRRLRRGLEDPCGAGSATRGQSRLLFGTEELEAEGIPASAEPFEQLLEALIATYKKS